MATSQKGLSTFTLPSDFNSEGLKFGIVYAEWNEEVTGSLRDDAIATLKEAGVSDSNIEIIPVPGSYELSFGAQLLAQKEEIDAVITLGCVIQGETPHFDYICQAVANGVTNVSLKYNKPVIFGVLTTLDQQQALERAGGRHGNKGGEAAYTAIKMLMI